MYTFVAILKFILWRYNIGSEITPHRPSLFPVAWDYIINPYPANVQNLLSS